MISDYQRTLGGLNTLTEHLDLASAKKKLSAADPLKKILDAGSLEIPDNDPITILRNTVLVENWVLNTNYYPEFVKWIGWSAETCELGLWPGAKQAKTLADKLELVSKGLTQDIHPDTGIITPKVIIHKSHMYL